MATTSSDRIFSLDAIRGVAVMGIFSVNIVAFAMIEGAYFNPGAYGGYQGLDLLMWAANMVVIDNKMRSLFSMLFGASMLLVIERTEASGQSGMLVHYRRMLVLMLLGIAHYFLIWWGDILTLYAVSGMIAYLARKRSARALVIWGIALILVQMALFSSFMFQMHSADLAAHAPGASQEAIRRWNEGMGTFYPTATEIAEDKAVFLSPLGPLLFKLANWGKLIGGITVFIPDTVGLMFLGMAGYKSGFLTGQWTQRRYRLIAATLIPIGMIGAAATVMMDISSHFYVITLMAGFAIVMTPFSTLQAFGYAALIILLTRNQGWLAQRIAATGRAAFTNYLGTSVIATFVFYGWGLGLYGSFSRAQAWLLVPIVWTIMLLWSKPWLDRHRYGPMEWVWRSLSRGSPQPMRR